jgi:hypothetical protein
MAQKQEQREPSDRSQLIYGRDRFGTERPRLSAIERAAQALAEEIAAYQAGGGRVEVSANGSQAWYRNGKLHREGGPAAEYIDGSKSWWRNGHLHRSGGPAVIICCRQQVSREEWWFDGLRHRHNGPAVTTSEGLCEWWINGQRHRHNGPAVEHPGGGRQWWVEGELHSRVIVNRAEPSLC